MRRRLRNDDTAFGNSTIVARLGASIPDLFFSLMRACREINCPIQYLFQFAKNTWIQLILYLVPAFARVEALLCWPVVLPSTLSAAGFFVLVEVFPSTSSTAAFLFLESTDGDTSDTGADIDAGAKVSASGKVLSVEFCP